MLAIERQQCIVEHVKQRGVVKTVNLSKEFATSAMTIRRDLAELEHRGLIRRVRGGAAAVASRDIGYGLRERINRREKEAVGQRAAQLVASGQSVFIDAGTTCIEVARHLLKRQLSSLFLVTTSVKVSAELAGSRGIKVTQLGGEIYDQSFGVVGDSVCRELAKLRFDWAFIGVSGFDLEAGLTNNNHFEIAVKRAAMHSARASVIAADSDKVGRAALAQISPIDEGHKIVTTASITPADLERLASYGWEVIKAG